MNHHLGILQQRVQAASIRSHWAFEQAKRPGRKIQQQKKEDLYAGENH